MVGGRNESDRYQKIYELPPVLITALHYWGYESNNDEAIQITNNTDEDFVFNSKWSLLDQANHRLRFPHSILPARQRVWISNDPEAFQRQFGWQSALGYDQMSGSQLTFANNGGSVRLLYNDDVVDTLVYGNGNAQTGWEGTPLLPYTIANAVSAEGQILARKYPFTDTNTAQDWLNDSADQLNGRRFYYPGWQFDRFSVPGTGSGKVTIAVSPDASFETLRTEIMRATQTIDIESYTFDSAAIAEILRNKSFAGVTVRVLLDGAPAGGLTDDTRYVCQLISTTTNPNSKCWFMRSDSTAKINARYRELHAKFVIIDNKTLVVSSENFGRNGYPADTKLDGTVGHRGLLAITSAPTIVAHARAIFDADLRFNHQDLTAWCAGCAPFGAPSNTFRLSNNEGGISYTLRYPQAFRTSDEAILELATSPESNLRDGGLIGLLNRAGAGDEILVEQLDEPTYWGAVSSSPDKTPNLRLAAVINAAKRGASVKILLDSFYDRPAPRSNISTTLYVNDIAKQYGLDLIALRGNPTAGGIHNKLFMMNIAGRKYVQIGSWNGSEVSAKRNREMTLLIESGETYDFLRDMFMRDFWQSQRIFFPISLNNSVTIDPAQHMLISEVMFDPIGLDTGREWVEIYNPTDTAIDLSSYKIGDAETQGKGGGDGMYHFPNGTTIRPQGVMVIAQNALLYTEEHGNAPTFEIGDYDPLVPNLISFSAWSNGSLVLSNSGDQIILLDTHNQIVDSVEWLSTALTSSLPYTQTVGSGYSLQRWPPNNDTNDNSKDFRPQPIPSPGSIP